MIVKKIIHHLTLKNNNNVHNATIGTVTIKTPQFLHIDGNARNQGDDPLWSGISSILVYMKAINLETGLYTDLVVHVNNIVQT